MVNTTRTPSISFQKASTWGSNPAKYVQAIWNRWLWSAAIQFVNIRNEAGWYGTFWGFRKWAHCCWSGTYILSSLNPQNLHVWPRGKIVQKKIQNQNLFKLYFRYPKWAKLFLTWSKTKIKLLSSPLFLAFKRITKDNPLGAGWKNINFWLLKIKGIQLKLKSTFKSELLDLGS